MKCLEKLPLYSAPVLRIAMVLVFLWFGTNQLIHPAKWVSYLPEFILGFGISDTQFVLANGAFEVIASILVLLGVYVRPVMALLGAHLFGIAVVMGFDAIAVRDYRLALATFAVAMNGQDQWCLIWPKKSDIQ